MLAIPGQQEFYAVNGGNGNMECVQSSFLRNLQRFHYRVGQLLDFRGNSKQRNSVQKGQPVLGCNRIACQAFVQHEARNDQLKVFTSIAPPILRCELIGRRSDVSAWSHRQVPNDRSLDVSGRIQFRNSHSAVTTGMTEGESLTRHKSNTGDRALRVHPIVPSSRFHPMAS